MIDLSQYKIQYVDNIKPLPEMIIPCDNNKILKPSNLPSITSLFYDLDLSFTLYQGTNFRSSPEVKSSSSSSTNKFNIITKQCKSKIELISPTKKNESFVRLDFGLSPMLPPFSRLKPKRKRAGRYQVKVLNDVFKENPFPNTELRWNLAKELYMSPRAVQIWFQNKRQAVKDELKNNT